MSEDRASLLGRNSTDSADDEATYKDAPSIAKFLGALSQGKLPDNNQLYTIFHKSAAFLDGISNSVSNSVDKDDDDEDDVFSDDTAMILGTLLKETGALSRLLARWIYGEEAKDEQKKDGDKEVQGARGNENEQIQRLLWHLARAFSFDTALPVVVDVDIPVDVNKAKESVIEGAKQVKEDSAASGRSIARLISLILSSEEVRRIPSDIIHFLRSSLADQVADVGYRVDNVEDALRGPSGEGGGEIKTNGDSKDFVEPDEALQEAAKGAQAVVEGASQGKGKEKETEDEKSAENALRDQVVNRTARLLDTLQSNEQYQQAVQTLVAVSEKYLNLLNQAKEDVSANIKQAEGKDEVEKVQSLAADGVEKVEEQVKATIASTHLDAKVSAQVSHHFVESLQATREVIEGLAGGKSMEEIVQKIERIKADVEKDSALREWLSNVNDFLSRTIGRKEGSNIIDMSTDEAKEELNSLYNQLQEVLRSRPEILEAIDDLKASCRAFYNDIESDVALYRIRSRFRRIRQLATMGLWEGAKDVKSKASQIMSLLVNAVVPSIGDILGSVPIPRVEFTSDNIDAVVEDVVIPVVSLIPDTIKVTTMNDWEWKRKPRRKQAHTNLDTNLQISMRGLQLAISDVSFYVQERFTAPSTTSCFSCCSFGQSQSNWCLFQGPSSWLAYTESALLDVGFWKKGLGVTLDLSDAGQTEEDQANKDKRDAMWDDDTITEGKRSHFFNVNKVDVQVDDSFDFKLRESRHWIINGILRMASRPLIKLVMKRIASAQIQHGYELLDAKMWDYHYRAKRLSLLRSESNLKWILIQNQKGLERGDVHATIWDYISVVMDADAGKSKARIQMELKKAQQEEKEAKRKEIEEQEQVNSTQPQVTKTMEVKPTSIIKHDADGQYSLSIGLAPRLLDPSKSGPKTSHIRLRDDLVQRNYKNLADRPKQKVLDVVEETDIQQTAKSTASEVQKAVHFVTDVVEGTKATNHVLAQDGQDDYDDQGWKSDAFSM